MGRFSRRREGDARWLAALPDRFSLDDLTDVTAPQELRKALSWLYSEIERGRIAPHHTEHGLRYELLARRRDDRPASPIGSRR